MVETCNKSFSFILILVSEQIKLTKPILWAYTWVITHFNNFRSMKGIICCEHIGIVGYMVGCPTIRVPKVIINHGMHIKNEWLNITCNSGWSLGNNSSNLRWWLLVIPLPTIWSNMTHFATNMTWRSHRFPRCWRIRVLRIAITE